MLDNSSGETSSNIVSVKKDYYIFKLLNNWIEVKAYLITIINKVLLLTLYI